MMGRDKPPQRSLFYTGMHSESFGSDQSKLLIKQLDIH